MLIVHLFVSYAHVDQCHFFLPPGVRGWLQLLLVALPRHFYLPFLPNSQNVKFMTAYGNRKNTQRNNLQ